MGLFDEQAEEITGYIDRALETGRAVRLEPPAIGWPEGRTIVLREDMALELGNPALGSLSVLVWTEGRIEDGRITLAGPDLPGAQGPGMPLAQAVIVSGRFPNEYDCYRDLRDAIYDTRLQGFSVRAMPSRQTLWCRVSTEASDRGLSFAHIGSAYMEALKTVEGVAAAEVLFVTAGRDEVVSLKPAADGAGRVVQAMMKMYEESNFDCETCEYADVCDTVMDLKNIRARLKGTRQGE